MNIIRTIKKSVLPNGSVLRLFVTIEDMYFINLETTHYGLGSEKTVKEMLWNSQGEWQFDKTDNQWIQAINDSKEIANRYFEEFKNNPLIGN